MKVRALQDHGNIYGDEFHKKAKAVYEIPDEREAQILIDAGLVEEVKK